MRLDEYSATTDLDGILTPTEMMRFVGVGFDIYQVSALPSGLGSIDFESRISDLSVTDKQPDIVFAGRQSSITESDKQPSIGFSDRQPVIAFTS